MNKSQVKKEVRKFLKQIDYDVSLSKLLQLSTYNIHFYNGENLSGDTILDSIGETEYAKTVNSFCLKKNERKVIFIKNGIDYEEKVFLILHEIGHLILEHDKNQDTYFVKTLEQEQEANLFAEMIFKYDKDRLIKRNILLTGIVLVGMIYFGISHTTKIQTENSECFITATGNRYHINCDYLKDNEGVIWLTIKEAENKGYTPCKECYPEKYK